MLFGECHWYPLRLTCANLVFRWQRGGSGETLSLVLNTAQLEQLGEAEQKGLFKLRIAPVPR